jgi:hypothetical protein
VDKAIHTKGDKGAIVHVDDACTSSLMRGLLSPRTASPATKEDTFGIHRYLNIA